MAASVSFNSVNTSGSTLYVDIYYSWSSPTYNQEGSAYVELFTNGSSSGKKYVMLASGGGSGVLSFTTSYSSTSGAYLTVIFHATNSTVVSSSYTVSGSGGGDTGGGGGGDTGGGGAQAYKIYFNEGKGTSIDARAYNNQDGWRQLSNGSTIYYKEDLKYDASCHVGYDNLSLTMNGNKAENITSTYASGSCWINSNVTLVSKATPISYTLTINQGSGTTISVKRIGSPIGGASSGSLSNGATIYYQDVLEVVFSASEIPEGYMLSTSSQSGQHVIYGNASFTSEIIVQPFKLVINKTPGSIVNVIRTESPLQNAQTNVILSNNSTIYYNDVLLIEYALSDIGDEILLHTLDGNVFDSGISYTVKDNVSIEVTASIKGMVYIRNGTEFEEYLVYIYNGTEFERYIPYVYDESNWIICS